MLHHRQEAEEEKNEGVMEIVVVGAMEIVVVGVMEIVVVGVMEVDEDAMRVAIEIQKMDLEEKISVIETVR